MGGSRDYAVAIWRGGRRGAGDLPRGTGASCGHPRTCGALARCTISASSCHARSAAGASVSAASS
eukprot:4963233-Prymnesium_polylepis.1